jgi:hypothetical protein
MASNGMFSSINLPTKISERKQLKKKSYLRQRGSSSIRARQAHSFIALQLVPFAGEAPSEEKKKGGEGEYETG